MVSGRSSQDYLRALTPTKSGKDGKGVKDKGKPKTKKDDKDRESGTCGRTSRYMSTCFKFKAVQS